MTRQSVAGKVCIVTGAAQGIGFAVARALAADGASVVVADLGTRLDGEGSDSTRAQAAATRIREETGSGCIASTTDVRDRVQVDAMVDDVVERFGGVDVLVNAAGNLRTGSVLTATVDDLRATMGVHVEGMLNTMGAIGRYWQRSPAPTPTPERRIINLSSESGLLGDPDWAAYAAAKAAVIGLTLSAAVTVADLGATANVLIPQAATRMTDSIPMDALPDTEGDRWASGEFDPVHVAPLLVYLASQRSHRLNGAIVGGWGFEVHRYAPAKRARSLLSPGPWDLETLFARLPAALDW
jgi:NAD(P)-dependent dehydrogenase (short-subunit alcohol dehydrogenase family)